MANKRVLSLVVVAIFAAGCSSTAATSAPTTAAPVPTTVATDTTAPVATTSTSTAASTNYYIPIISKGWSAQFWVAVKQGAQDEATKEGVNINFEGPDNETQVDTQLTMLQNELAKKPAALCFAALDGKAATPILQQYTAANIPVIGFDSGVDPFVPVTTVATDNTAAAALAADQLGAYLKGAGTVGIIVQDQVALSATSRRDGFVNEMKAKYPNIKLLTPQYGAADITKSADIAKSMIQANPNLSAIFGTNEQGAEGAVQGVTEAGKAGKVLVVGYDSGKAQIDAINSGTELGAITQNPVGIGAQCVIAAVKAIKGTSQAKTVDTGFYWYDKTNITDPKIVADLYQ
jgi:ribose transport system substrate-binding protein